jgi:hypothetical protein
MKPHCSTNLEPVDTKRTEGSRRKEGRNKFWFGTQVMKSKMRTDFYSIVLSSTLVLVANCFNLDRELQNFDQSLLEAGSNERSSKCKPPEFLLS